MSMIYCPTCGRHVSSRARACPGCGEPIAVRVASRVRSDSEPVYPLTPIPPLWSPGIAAVLSFFIPGLGQIYKGQILNGLLWMLFVPVGYYLFCIPGAVLHLLCIFGAASGDPTRYRR